MGFIQPLRTVSSMKRQAGPTVWTFVDATVKRPLEIKQEDGSTALVFVKLYRLQVVSSNGTICQACYVSGRWCFSITRTNGKRTSYKHDAWCHEVTRMAGEGGAIEQFADAFCEYDEIIQEKKRQRELSGC